MASPVWESELVPMLAAAPALTATTLLEGIQWRYPGQYDDALLRTLQRRVRTWTASYGKEREVFFAQPTSAAICRRLNPCLLRS